MMRALTLLAAVALLSGCSSYTAHQARKDLLGLTTVDLEMCAGVPNKVETMKGTDGTIWQYDFSRGSDGHFPVPLVGSLEIGGSSCHAVFLLENGRTTKLRYAGDTDSIWGPYSACGPIVQGCERNHEHIQLAPGLPPDPVKEADPAATKKE